MTCLALAALITVTGGAAVIIVTTMTMAENVIVHQANCVNKQILIIAHVNHFKVAGKNIPAHTVKIEPVRRVFQAKVKMHKPVPIALLAKQRIKVLMPNQVKVQKMPALEIVKVPPHVAFDVASRN